MPETSQQRSSGYYRFLEFCRVSWVYVLLLGGAVVFSWPFLWMATTSVKVDREMFGDRIRLWPQQPIPRAESPYIETRQYRDLKGPRLSELLPVLEQRLGELDYPWPAELDRPALIRQAARGLYRRLLDTLPRELWRGDRLAAAAVERVDPALVEAVVGQVRRCLLLGQVRARSFDLQEDQLVDAAAGAAVWETGGSGASQLVPVADPREPHVEWRYDLSAGDTVTLSATFTTSFPIERLYRLQLYLRHDDSWHGLTAYVEKLGVRYRAERPHDLSDYTNWGLVTWQEPGPDDHTNKIKSWILLREIDRGPQYENDPHRLRVVLELKRNSDTGAWWAKMCRNYRLALEHIPFWRYVATSVFLVILNLVGTLLSCSLVAYSFARLQWPGRGFCFGLMLATMMVPPQVTMIPYFLIIRQLGWYNTLYPLWVGSLFAGAFNVFLLRQFLKGVPRDLEDAAKIDGCGFWRVYWHIMLPLVKPTLAAIAIFTFMGTWNDFMGPLIYLSDQRLYPLSLGLYAFNVQSGGSMGMMMAGSLLMTVPVIVIFFFAQRYFIQGVTLTGMKG
ncbi:ABC transporter permease subunit [bacterium]|nr:ABC transporter permease subunit [bacterium]